MMIGEWLKGILARVARYRLSVAVAGLLTVLLGWMALPVRPAENAFTHLSYDLASLALPRTDPSEVIIVHMDEHSHGVLTQSWGKMWDRSLHATLLKKLQADHARLAVFDVFMRDPGDPQDAFLAQAMKAFGPVVLAAIREPVKDPASGLNAYQTIPPLKLFRESAAGWGLVTVNAGWDGGIRLHHGGTDLDPSLSWTAAKLAGAPIAAIPDWETATELARRKGWPPPQPWGQAQPDFTGYIEFVEGRVRQQERWIRYYGRPDTIPGISYARALEVGPGFFADKFVFIGGKPQALPLNTNPELYRTPYSRRGGLLTAGVEIQATMFLNLLEEDWLIRAAAMWDYLMVIVGGLLFATLFRLVSPVNGLIAAVVSALVVSLVALLLIRQMNVWFVWMIPVGLQIPCAVLCAIAAHTTEFYHRRRLPVIAGLEEPALQPIKLSVPEHALLRCLQRTEQGEVWLAKDSAGAYRAVKLVQRHQFEKADAYTYEFNGLRRFREMAQSQAGFVQVFSVAKQSGFFHCVAESADDETTGQQIDPDHYSPKTLAREINRRGRLPPVKCLELGLALSQALEHAHQHGFLHLNVKPSNILFVNGHPKLAEVAGGVPKRRLHFGSSMGMEGFAAPDPSPSAAWDVYSLGMVLYAASTGMTPDRFPEPPSQGVDPLSGELINDLNRIISVACSRDLSRRFKSASEIHADLLLALSHQLERDRELSPRLTGPGELENVGGHRLLRRIGQGAFGEVWLGRNQVGLYHAVKIVSRDQFSDADPYEREFEGLKHFMGISRSHPGFVQIHHVDRDDEAGYFFYVMEAGDDEALGQKIDPGNYRAKSMAGELKRRGPLPPGECLNLMIDLNAALAHLHKLELIHRDIKPSNIIYVENAPKLADIGLVTSVAEKSKVTVIGTLGYMAPEGPRTAAADVYSMGKLLYTIFTGLRPDRFPELSTTIVDEADTPIMNGLMRIMFKACEVDVRERYPSAVELHEDLCNLRRETSSDDEDTVVGSRE